MTISVAVLGASGFVGSAAVQALHARGAIVRPIKTPRLPHRGLNGADSSAESVIAAYSSEVTLLADQLKGVDVAVNCAGDPNASSQDVELLNRANGYLVGVTAEAATQAAVERFLHVSSAVVQGRIPTLDQSLTYDPFSPYARAKILGERLALAARPAGTIIYRPPSVHAVGRRVTQMTSRIAKSRLSTVAAPGDQPTPQALISNVADAIAFLATCDEQPPAVVAHPWEGLTSASLLEILGGRHPIRIPRPLARVLTDSLRQTAKVVPAVAANARRIEMIWFGQRQGESWLTQAGWRPQTPWSENCLVPT